MSKKVRWIACSEEQRDHMFQQLLKTAGSENMTMVNNPYDDGVTLTIVFDVPMLRSVKTSGEPRHYAYNADVKW